MTTELETTRVKTVVEERSDDAGKKVKITRKIRMRLVSTTVSADVAIRAHWARFGDAAGSIEMNNRSTITSEPVYLHLSARGRDEAASAQAAKAPVVEVKAVECQHCKGPHWTARCPNKDLFALDKTPALSVSSAFSNAPGSSGGPEKYISPALRARIESGASVASSFDINGLGSTSRENPYTVRISNLPEICTEQDIRDLCKPIALVTRAHVVRDMRTQNCRGSAFVSFSTMHDVERVVKIINGHPYGNLILKAEIAKPPST